MRTGAAMRGTRGLGRTMCACGVLLLAGRAGAQISMTAAVDLAIKNSPRLKSSQADVEHASAALSESKDVYIPSLSAGASLGQAYGYSNYPPTLFTLTSSSLIYSSSQFSYIHSAHFALQAAELAFQDMRETVAEDAALTFVALDHDQQREEALRQESGFAGKLQEIVQERFDAGTDTKMDLLDAKLTVANLRVAGLNAAQNTANDRMHLARLMGIPEGTLRADGGFPPAPIADAELAPAGVFPNASVASAFANADAKLMQAKGDAKFLYRPQVSLAAQFNRYATFTNAWKDIESEYHDSLGADETVFGVTISIPLLDRARRARALETAADAAKARHDAEFAQVNVLDAQGRLDHSLELLRAQGEVAQIEQERAQEQLRIIQIQLDSPGAGPPLTPKDQVRAQISERDKYLAVVDAAFTLHQNEISLLRQRGRLVEWLAHAGLTGAPGGSSTVQPHP